MKRQKKSWFAPLMTFAIMMTTLVAQADEDVIHGDASYYALQDKRLITIEGAPAKALFQDLQRYHTAQPCENGTGTLVIALPTMVCTSKPKNDLGPEAHFCQTLVDPASGALSKFDVDYCPALSIIGVRNGQTEGPVK